MRRGKRNIINPAQAVENKLGEVNRSSRTSRISSPPPAATTKLPMVVQAVVAAGLTLAVYIFLSADMGLQRYLSKTLTRFVRIPRNLDFLEIALLWVGLLMLCLFWTCFSKLPKMYSKQRQYFGKFGLSQR